jgi:hypothetical protein
MQLQVAPNTNNETASEPQESEKLILILYKIQTVESLDEGVLSMRFSKKQ